MRPANNAREELLEIYRRLFQAYGPQHWWPAEGPFEVMVGAVLTQSAAWTNVEKAIANLKAADALSPAALRRLSQPDLAALVRPSGYFNVKAKKLRALADWFGDCCGDSVDVMRGMITSELRERLLSVWGVGEETADSIILYVAEQPVFVVDAYTKRIMQRVGIDPERHSYGGYQALFTGNLPRDVVLFNEYHALLVRLGKNVCRPRPSCQMCCLDDLCARRTLNSEN